MNKKITYLSPVWIVPIVAFIIAVWLGVQARMEKGTEVQISFASASDIVPGQTQVRLKDVKVGMVKSVRLSKDLKRVNVNVELDRDISDHLSEHTRFWVVTPRISAKGVSNLGTLISGVYIVMDAGDPGAFKTKFDGLDEPPLLHSDDMGGHYVLQADALGSLDIGSPIYYRQIKVGEVTGYKLAENQQYVDINFFVRAPHDQMVQKRSRFWNVSGFGVTVGAEGLKAKMASLSSLIAGGIEFDNVVSFEPAERADQGHRFYLYSDRESVLEERFSIKYFYRLRFSGSVRGLNVGAPVEFRGIKVGEVIDVVLASSENIDESLHVYIAMEPQRFDASEEPTKEEVDSRLRSMVAQGLRAQMSTSSLITGAKYIDLAYFEDTPGEFVIGDDFAELPTTGDAVSQITQKMDGVLDQISKLPIEQIGSDFGASMASLKNILATLDEQNTALKLDGAVANLQDTLASADKAVRESEQLMSGLKQLVAPDSEIKHELGEMLRSLSDVSGSIRRFINELNRHPNSLISGAEKDE